MADELNINEKIGSKLKQLRMSKNMSLRDFEIISKIRYNTYYEYERGKTPITVDKLEAILSIYGISLGKFLDDIRNFVPEPSFLEEMKKNDR